MKSFQDEHLGLLRWDEDFEEWVATTAIPLHDDVDVGLPPEYLESANVHNHIVTTLELIKREELSFRERAAQELFDKGSYVLWILEGQQFNHAEFVANMHLVVITFSLVESLPLTLRYEYGDEGMEHGMFIALSWDSVYQYAREG